MNKIDMQVNIAGVTLKNPIVTASGTCGFGQDYLPHYKPSELGAITVKALTIKPKLGNPVPRICETNSGILNSIGLQNPGVDHFIEQDLPKLEADGAVVIANIAGNTSEDMCAVAEKLSETSVQLLELNISCPNVKEGGISFGVRPELAAKVVSEVKKHCKKPLIVKLSPNVSDITEIARAVEAVGADAVSLINTLLGMRINIKTRRPMLANNTGGLSGPAVFPVAVRMVWQVRNAVNIPIIGMGGISSASDAVEMMLAGADAVSIGTAMFSDPCAPIRIINDLEKYCADNGIARVSELTGALKAY